MTTTVLGRPGWWGLPVGYGVAGIGMGLTHLDTMNRIVTDPAEPDGITHAQAATAVTIAGAAGGAVLGTVTTAFVAPHGIRCRDGPAVADTHLARRGAPPHPAAGPTRRLSARVASQARGQ